MLGSKSTYFKQSPLLLRRKRNDVEALLAIKGYSYPEINIYLAAYDYFCTRTLSFDGVTIVKDLFDIPDLDIDAMLHDYHYIVQNAGSNFTTKWKVDWIYAKGNERKGKGSYSAYTRFVALTIIGIGFVPYAYVTRGCISEHQKQALQNDYKILIK